LHGLTRTLINNMIEGVEKQFSRTLEVNGVGYRAQLKGKKLVMNLGYSHPVEMDAPEGITFEVPNPNTIIVKGIDKEVVGQTAAVVRTKRPPEVYRGKGIKYAEEHIRRKEGKAGKK
ncbi:MAG: 50S ribosomal protein L6, partial [Clostridia bacterium]|nr:50S ribosomal protein L6 [Clostridia bacterium]